MAPRTLAVAITLIAASFCAFNALALPVGSAAPRSLAPQAAARDWGVELGLSGAEATPLSSYQNDAATFLSPAARVRETLDSRAAAAAAWAAGRWAAAAAAYARLTELDPYDPDAWEMLGRSRHRAGDFAGALAPYRRAAEAGAGQPYDHPYRIACCLARLGDPDAALAWLDRAFALGYRHLADLRTEPDLASLRPDPRFRALADLVDFGALSRDDGWRHDLDLLRRELYRLHHDPARVTPRAELDRRFAALREAIPGLTDAQVAVALMQIMAAVGDAHTRVGPGWGPPGQRHDLPLTCELFADGLFVTAADPAYGALAGAEVLAVAGRPVAEVFAALADLIPRDNDLWLRVQTPRWLTHADVLHGLGLLDDPAQVTLTVRRAGDDARDVVVTTGPACTTDAWISAGPGDDADDPPSVRLANRPCAFTPIAGTRALYVAVNTWRDDPAAPMAAFFARMFAHADSARVDRLIIDLRRNGGGDNFLARPLWQGIVARPLLNQRGRIFVLVGRRTFSAGVGAAVQLERHTAAVVIGEPTSSPPNFVGENVVVDLPYSGLRATVSDLYWQNGNAMDYRAWLAPEVYVPPTFADYRAGRDPALAAALAWPTPRVVGPAG